MVFVSGRDIPNLVLKEKKFNAFGQKSSNMKAKELGRILFAMGDISVVFASSCNDNQIQLQDVKGIKLENNIVTLI